MSKPPRRRKKPIKKDEVDKNLIRRLARIDCTLEEIAGVIGCSTEFLSDSYSDIIRAERMRGNASLRRTQYRKALAGNDKMLIWLGKNRLGQRDSVHTFHSVDDALAKMTEEELLKEARRLDEIVGEVSSSKKPELRAISGEIIDVSPKKTGTDKGDKT